MIEYKQPKTKLSDVRFHAEDALTDEQFEQLIEEPIAQKCPSLMLLIMGDTGDGKTHTMLKTLHEDMFPALYIHCFREKHGFTMPKGVASICFEKDSKKRMLESPEEKYDRLLQILHAPAIAKYKLIAFDSMDLDHIIWEHTYVKNASNYQDSRVAKQMYHLIVNRFKELAEMGIHTIATMGVSIFSETDIATPWMAGKPGKTVPSWFFDRLIVRMNEIEKEGKTTLHPLWATKTILEKSSKIITGIEEDANSKTKVKSATTLNVARCRLRDIDSKPLHGRPASIKTLWNYILKKHESK